MVCGVCIACLLTPLYSFVWLPDVSLVFLHSPLFLSPIHVDARALCEAALSLKKLGLTVVNSGTHEALAGIFDLQPLKELVISLYRAEVSSACMCVCMYVCM